MTAAAFAALERHRDSDMPRDMRKAFVEDPARFERFSASLDDMLLDWSKCRVSDKTMALLVDLARSRKVEDKRNAMFAGAAINSTEGRAVLHTALRNRSNRPVLVAGKDVMPEVNDVLQRMAKFCRDITSAGHISDVINIGIGGSDLGPAMATQALVPYHGKLKVHFVSNVDGAHLADTIRPLDPAKTLVIIASKTFTTQETMANAQAARRWIADKLGEDSVSEHFAAVSSAVDKAAKFGIPAERVFGFWDWVGGRYSVWSAIGLPVMMAVGPESFFKFLDGAHAMDEHFRTAPLAKNLPAILGLLGIWHRNLCGHGSRAIIPYDQRMARFPAHLQQLDMESNGKSVTLNGTPVQSSTGPVVWGEPGTNGQHAFFQLLHQGTDPVPIEFLIAAQGHEPAMRDQHAMLIANCLAQSEALMKGRTLDEAHDQLLGQGKNFADAARIAPHRVFSGNRPSLTILYRRLDPYTLGRLIALYEHRVFVEGAIWNINSFDQWGVELGKELANDLLPVIEGKASSEGHDSSTRGLAAHLASLT